MKSVQKIDLGLTGYDELFMNDAERKENKLPRIYDIPLSEIDDFPDHKEIKEAPPADIPLLLRAMRQAGYNLDQTLKRFNTTNVPDMPQFRKGLEEIRAATKMVSDAYTSDYQ